MRKLLSAAAVAVLASLVLPAGAPAGEKKVIEKTFDRVEEIRIETVLGGCTIEKGGDGIEVRLEYTYDDEDFKARFREKGGALYVEEVISGDDLEGESHWTIRVPAGISVEFESATGSLEASGLSGELEASSGTGSISIGDFAGELEVSSGTGDIEISGCKGELEAGSGTGDVVIERCVGDYELSSGTGDVEARDFEIAATGEFSSGTGETEIELPGGEDYELDVSSGTGDAGIDCRGRDLDAYVEMRTGRKAGRIRSSFGFDGEEESEGDNGHILKYLTSGNGKRKISISTGTGTARLKK